MTARITLPRVSVPLGTVMVNGKEVEVKQHPEISRFFESLLRQLGNGNLATPEELERSILDSDRISVRDEEALRGVDELRQELLTLRGANDALRSMIEALSVELLDIRPSSFVREVWASIVAPNQFPAAQAVTPVALTDAATISTNCALGNSFYVTLGGNRTLANPTSPMPGQICTWLIQQDGTGSRTLAFGNKFKFSGGTAPTMTTAANAMDQVSAQYWPHIDKWVSVVLPNPA